MEQLNPHIYTFILPLFLGNLLHMVIVKRNYFPALAKPISITLLGSGKTYRAFAVMPLICGCSSLLFRTTILHEPNYYWSFAIGFILGFVYLLAELPNSFVKRRLNILPGQSHPGYKTLQYFADKTDSLIPLCILYYFISGISISVTLLLFAVSFFIHVLFSWLLFKFRIKKSF